MKQTYSSFYGVENMFTGLCDNLSESGVCITEIFCDNEG